MSKQPDNPAALLDALTPSMRHVWSMYFLHLAETAFKERRWDTAHQAFLMHGYLRSVK